MTNPIDTRQKLETAIERETFRFIESIKEHMCDHVMIWLNRQNIDLDRQVAGRLLELAKTGIEDGMMSKMDLYKSGLDKVLTEFTETENPTEPGSSSQRTKKQHPKS